MAIMISCARDWTYDVFHTAMEQYEGTPQKGVHCREDASDIEQFVTWFKNQARDFREQWLGEYNSEYVFGIGWIGDAFEEDFDWDWFSDYYKDVFGQRPHLPRWYYIHPLGMPMLDDVGRTFCADPINDAISNAKLAKAVY